MEISSPSIPEGIIDKVYTCEGANKSIDLEWSGVPKQAKSLALIMYDPDAVKPPWIHWILYNIPTNVTRLGESIRRYTQFSSGACQGINSNGHIGYDGPCPPDDKIHHYHFLLLALDTTIEKLALNIEQLSKEIEGHILKKAEYVGIYARGGVV